MKTYRWAVVELGTWKRVNWEGYKTKKEAIRMAEEFTKVTGKNHVVVDETKKYGGSKAWVNRHSSS